MLGALERHFKNAGHEFGLIKDKEFAECRQVLNGKAIELRELGKGKQGTKQMLSQKRKRKLCGARVFLEMQSPQI